MASSFIHHHHHYHSWVNRNVFSFPDSQEAVQQQHDRGQVRCVRTGIRGVSPPELQNTPPLRQKQRPGAAGTAAYSVCLSVYWNQAVISN